MAAIGTAPPWDSLCGDVFSLEPPCAARMTNTTARPRGTYHHNPRKRSPPRKTIVPARQSGHKKHLHLFSAFRRGRVGVGQQVLGSKERSVHVDVLLPQSLGHGSPARELSRLEETAAAAFTAREVALGRSLQRGRWMDMSKQKERMGMHVCCNFVCM